MPVAPENPLDVTTQQLATVKLATVKKLLDTIADELKALSWWQETPPDAKALASTLPFAVDTLSLAQWLQFVLLARLRTQLAIGMPLPSKISVYPMAQESFAGVVEDTSGLTEAIAQLDEALSGQPVERQA
ncbi:YqcC family protein [Oceanisphaera sp. IT1-181]|uniref:YqcC family protein n=1 Tax=Oceanisphaera sp. IT1-181 TaxID=3081199 RepID=UPI0029CA6D8B|nr:YqcC family protein [Oceanisphaera sp. IT1-181]